MLKRSISPMRYPGGKAKMYNQIIDLLNKNNLKNKIYIEPFAGGCGLAFLLLQNNDVEKIILNDIDRSIYALWFSILNKTEEFCNLIKNSNITLEEREKQKLIQDKKNDINLLELGFSTFFLNRVNHSGIIKGGPIGGAKQESKYKIDCRFNKTTLINQVIQISKLKDKIELYNLDVINFIDDILPKQPIDSFVFLDPPYYKKGPGLYVNFYTHENHLELSKKIKDKIKQHWIVTYDNIDEIKKMYFDMRKEEFDISYTLQVKQKAKEVIIYSNSLDFTL